jgi:hypothetical protein
MTFQLGTKFLMLVSNWLVSVLSAPFVYLLQLFPKFLTGCFLLYYPDSLARLAPVVGEVSVRTWLIVSLRHLVLFSLSIVGIPNFRFSLLPGFGISALRTAGAL